MENIIALIKNSLGEGTAPTLGLGALAELDAMLEALDTVRSETVLGVPPHTHELN